MGIENNVLSVDHLILKCVGGKFFFFFFSIRISLAMGERTHRAQSRTIFTRLSSGSKMQSVSHCNKKNSIDFNDHSTDLNANR